MYSFEDAQEYVVDWGYPSAEQFPSPHTTPVARSSAPCGEVRYIVRREEWDPILVEAIFNPDGTKLFEEQEQGEHGWFDHPLAPGEEAFALDLLRRYPSLPTGKPHPRFETHPLPVFVV
jgi:hypothetical protein